MSWHHVPKELMSVTTDCLEQVARASRGRALPVRVDPRPERFTPTRASIRFSTSLPLPIVTSPSLALLSRVRQGLCGLRTEPASAPSAAVTPTVSALSAGDVPAPKKEFPWLSMPCDLCLGNLLALGWEGWRVGPESTPFGEVFVYRWPDHADVLVVTRRISAEAYRTPLSTGADPFSPEVICWSFGGRTTDSLKRLLALPHPGDSRAPHWGQRFHGTARVPSPWRQAVWHRVALSSQQPCSCEPSPESAEPPDSTRSRVRLEH